MRECKIMKTSIHVQLVYMWIVRRIKTEEDLLKLALFLDCFKSTFSSSSIPPTLIEEIFLLRKVRTSRNLFDCWEICRYIEECMTGTEQQKLLEFLQNQPIASISGEIE